MVFYDQGAKTGMTRVYDRLNVAHRKTIGTADRDEAKDVDAFVKRMRKHRRWSVLEAIIADQLTCAEAYRADVAGTLPSLLDEIAARKTQQESEAADPDLSPLVDLYLADVKYRMQVRRLIPVGVRFPASRFTRKVIADFLRTLTRCDRDGTATSTPAAPSTKSRYKAALSSFAVALVEHEVLSTNPVRDVSTPRQSKAGKTPVFLEPAQVRTLVERLPLPYQAMEALMAGSGMEWGAIAALRARDVDVDTRQVYARGTKNEYRERFIEVSEDWAWAIVRAYVRGFTPEATLFPIREETALKYHHAAAKALGYKRTTLHQHRHAFAVMHLKRGCDHQWLKNQLGHAPHSTLIYTVYGVYINAARMTGSQPAKHSPVSDSVSPPEKSHEVA